MTTSTVNLPFRDLSHPFASFLGIIEYLPNFASIATGNFSVDTYIEVLTVVRIGISGMSLSHGFVYFRATELEDIFAGTASFLGLIWPCANASLWIKYQTCWAGDHVELSIHAVVEFVTDTLVLVTEISMESGAV